MNHCTNIFIYVAAADLNMHSLLVQSLHGLNVEAESLCPGG